MTHYECEDCGWVGEPKLSQEGLVFCNECDSQKLSPCDIQSNGWVMDVIPVDGVLKEINNLLKQSWSNISEDRRDTKNRS
jgi:hypothetical protein